MMHNKVRIQFKNAHQLWNFAKRLKASDIEINISRVTLYCHCTEVEIRMLSQHGGLVIEQVSHSIENHSSQLNNQRWNQVVKGQVS